jgi:hypothetical protein
MAEITNEMVASAKKWLRIETQATDDEVRQTLEACLLDLSIGGVAAISTTDKLIQQAMKLYLKSQYGYDPNADKFGQAYEHLKRALALCGDYNTPRPSEESNSAEDPVIDEPGNSTVPTTEEPEDVTEPAEDPEDGETG